MVQVPTPPLPPWMNTLAPAGRGLPPGVSDCTARQSVDKMAYWRRVPMPRAVAEENRPPKTSWPSAKSVLEGCLATTRPQTSKPGVAGRGTTRQP
ncbi:unnamed protein product, partial [Clonostachys solani]